MQQSLRNYKRIVVKVGSSLFYSGKNTLDLGLFEQIARQLTQLLKEGKEVVLVSSGAITLGISVLGLKEKPRDLATLQAVAAIGQNALMDGYNLAFSKHKINCAQILLTWEDFSNRKRYLNAKNTLLKLFLLGSVSVINENDTVSTEEIKFGDNDLLSALVSSLINADLLVILSDVDGLLDQHKKVIPLVEEITPQVKLLACPSQKKTCVGGMITKLEAAKIAVDSGIPCVITNGHVRDSILSAVHNPGACGTIFTSKKSLAAKKRWLAFGSRPQGKVMVDEGAKKALLNRKSLLAVGVVGCSGDFAAQDIITLVDKQGNEFARGKISLSARMLERIKGTRQDKEIIHCDNIVIL